MLNKDLYMKTVSYKQLKSSMILVLALGMFTACGSGGTAPVEDDTGDTAIANIEEASGICYSTANNALFVVSDEGVLYKLDMSGKILKKQVYTYTTSGGSEKKYDFEGVACDDAQGNVAIAVEKKENIMTIRQDTFEREKAIGDIERAIINDVHIMIKYDEDNATTNNERYEDGIEGITMDTSGKVYLSHQSNVAYPGTDSSFIFTVDSYTAPHPLVDTSAIIDPTLIDMSGLAYYNDSLYIVHETNKLSQYDISTKVIKTINLPTGIDAQGVTFDNDGNIYFADDEHGKVLKYKASELGIE